ncbi:MAG TPA: caspase family protein [Terrimicrobiaceae bacterium]
MVKGAKSGDYLVFHYSGHGSQIRDRLGDELSDSLDELICPRDMNCNTGTHITDDDLNKIFTTLPAGVLLEVYPDSCNSGTGLRVLDLGRPSELGPPNPTLNRYIEPPIDLLARFEGKEDAVSRRCSC